MKTISTLMLAAALTLTLAGSKVCCSQTVATGNVTAEVIESVGAGLQAFTSFEIVRTTVPGITTEQTSLTAETIDLGAITIISGIDITCNIVVMPASLSDSGGNGFTLEPSIKIDPFASATQTNCRQTFQLDGKANMARSQASGLYEGSYTVVIAYN